MASENSFDIVSKVDLQEVSNAIQNALKEIHTRFDLKDSKSDIKMEGKDALILSSANEYNLKAVNDILQSKLVKRNVSIKAFTYGVVEPAANSSVRQKVTMQQSQGLRRLRGHEPRLARGIHIRKIKRCQQRRQEVGFTNRRGLGAGCQEILSKAQTVLVREQCRRYAVDGSLDTYRYRAVDFRPTRA